MGADEALLLAGVPGARVYQWDGVWVSLGRFQQPSSVLVDPSSVPWVMRPTGGLAVVHDGDWTLGYALPHLVEGERNTRRAYERLTAPLIAALGLLGFEVAYGGGEVRGGDGIDCFAFSSRYDLVEVRSGLKIAGCAMRMTRTGALLQASIPASLTGVLNESPLIGGATLPTVRWTAEQREAFQDAVRRMLETH
jgi:lipoate-protein ligase A